MWRVYGTVVTMSYRILQYVFIVVFIVKNENVFIVVKTYTLRERCQKIIAVVPEKIIRKTYKHIIFYIQSVLFWRARLLSPKNDFSVFTYGLFLISFCPKMYILFFVFTQEKKTFCPLKFPCIRFWRTLTLNYLFEYISF